MASAVSIAIRRQKAVRRSRAALAELAAATFVDVPPDPKRRESQPAYAQMLADEWVADLVERIRDRVCGTSEEIREKEQRRRDALLERGQTRHLTAVT